MTWTTDSLNALCQLDAPEFRQTVALTFMKALKDIPPEQVLKPAQVTNTTFKGPKSEVPIRIYTPESDGSSKLPCIVYYHGGGWVICNLDSHDAVCRRLCVQSGSVVVSVDYRLAPEHPFPEPLDDCYAALEYVHKNADSFNIDANKIAVAGDSAGANISTVVAILARDNHGPPIKFQCLVYPATDFTINHDNIPCHENAFLAPQTINYFRNAYLKNGGDIEDIRLSPAKADLTGLPPAWVVVAELDPLRSEGVAYAEKLKSQGVSVELVTATGLDHGFWNANTNISPVLVQYQDAAAAAIKKALA